LTLDWQAQLLRVSLFLKRPVPFDQSVWRYFTDQIPEIDERRAKEALHREAGPWRRGFLEVRNIPIRLDVLFTAPQIGPLTTPELPSLVAGSFRTEMPIFAERVEAFLSKYELSATRIALGCILLLSAEDLPDAYRLLQKCLFSVKVDPNRMRDFIFRVNWPVDHDGKMIKLLNRLTTWTANTVIMTVAQTPGQEQVLREDYNAQLEIDHNSPAENTQVLEREELIHIFRKLTDLAIENVERGERR
jgi:hypothetical protein